MIAVHTEASPPVMTCQIGRLGTGQTLDFGGKGGYCGARNPDMEQSETILCPFCGQPMELVIDTSSASQRFTTDCEVCCRPFEGVAECEPGEVVSLEVLG